MTERLQDEGMNAFSTRQDAAIVYKSKYGACLRYANWLADALDAPIVSLRRADPEQLRHFKCVILVSSIRGDRIRGRRFFSRNWEYLDGKALFCLAVGVQEAREGLEEELLEENFRLGPSGLRLFYARGVWDPQAFSKKDRAYLRMLQKYAKRHGLSERDRWLERFLGDKTRHDWCRKAALKPLLQALKQEPPEV